MDFPTFSTSFEQVLDVNDPISQFSREFVDFTGFSIIVGLALIV